VKARLFIGLLLAACGGEASLDERVGALEVAFDAGANADVARDAPALLELGRSGQLAPARVWKLQKLHLLALARLGRGSDAAASLEQAAQLPENKVSPELYCQVADLALSAGDIGGSIDVLDAGVRAYPGREALFVERLENCREAASRSENDELRDRLAQIPYLNK